MTARIIPELTGHRSVSVVDTVAVHGDNMAAAMWVKTCGGARDRRVCLVMRILGRLEIKGCWRVMAKHEPGVRAKHFGGWYIPLAPSRADRNCWGND